MSLFDILAGTSDGVFAVTSRQRIAFWNASARRMLGFEPAAVLGRPCHEVLGGRSEDGCAVCERGCETFRASLRGSLSPTRDVEVHASGDRRRWLSVSTFLLPSRYHGLSLLAHVFRDRNAAGDVASSWQRLRSDLTPRGPSEPIPTPFEPLTGAEREVLRLLACGASTDSICARLDVRKTTARTHVQHILQKLGAHSRLEAVAVATRTGLVRPSEE